MKGFFRENLSLKIMSLVLAILLEAYFYSPENSITAEFSVPIEIKNLSPAMVIVKPSGAGRVLYARVTASGPAPLVEQFKASNNKFVVDLNETTKNSVVSTLNPEQLRVPSGVRVYVQPSRVDFYLEQLVQKELEVKLSYTGEPAPGYLLESLEVIPSKVTAEGPQSEIEVLSSINTQPIDIEGLKKSKRFDVLLEDYLPHVKFDTSVFSVLAKVAPKEAERKFTNANVTVHAPTGFAATVEPSKLEVTLLGPEETLLSLHDSDINFIVDAQSLEVGKHEMRPAVKLPQGVKVFKTKPEQVIVTLVNK